MIVNKIYNTNLVNEADDLTSQPGRVKWPDVMSIYRDVSGVHVIESLQ